MEHTKEPLQREQEKKLLNYVAKIEEHGSIHESLGDLKLKYYISKTLQN